MTGHSHDGRCSAPKRARLCCPTSTAPGRAPGLLNSRTVFIAEGNTKPGKSTVKAHRAAEPYAREREVYERLREAGVTEILGFHVPQLVRADDELHVIEMTILTRPFVLDFAGVYLDMAPEFPEETWAEWEAEKREQFEGRWPVVQSVLAALE